MDVVYAGILVVGLMAVFLAVGSLILGFLIVLNGLVESFANP